MCFLNRQCKIAPSFAEWGYRVFHGPMCFCDGSSRNVVFVERDHSFRNDLSQHSELQHLS